MTLMVTNILHQGTTTYLRIFIDNQTSLPCNLSQASFEHIYVLRRFLFFTKEQRKLVKPLHAPIPIQLPAYSSAYFVLFLPKLVQMDFQLPLAHKQEYEAIRYTFPARSFYRPIVNRHQTY